MPIFILLTSVISVFSVYTPSQAATSDTLNFQGRLLDNSGGLVADGSYNIEFNLYTVDVGGASEWTETRLNSAAQGVTVQNGYFSAYLGDITAFGGGINWDQEHWLGMTVRGTGSCAFGVCTPTDAEMTPRFKLTAVPYAFRAGAVLDSAGNAYTGDDLVQISPGSVQTTNAAVSALRINQTGAGGLFQLQGDGLDVFTVDKTGSATLGAGITVGNSLLTTAGTIRWTGADLEVYDGTQWTSLTGSAGGVGTTAIKSVDETITSDAVLNNDADLNFSIGANETWSFRFVVQGNSAAQPDFQFAVSAPGGATCDVGVSDPEGATSISNLGCGVSSGVVPGTGNDEIYEVVGTVVNGVTAGTVSLQWAQNTSNAGNTTIYSGSYVLATSEGAAAGGGGGVNPFEQNGNAFGATAVLGTTDTNGLDIITDSTVALAFTSTGAATFNNGLTLSSGDLALSGGNITSVGSVTGTAALTVSSGGAGDLILDSASNILILADDTLRRSGTGTTTLDLLDASADTTFVITNSDGTRVADLSVEGAISATDFSGSGSGITNLDGSNVASGTIADIRLSSNIALLNGSQTFTGLPTFNSGLILGGSASTTAGATRWSGSDFEGFDGVQWVSFTSGGGGGGGSTSPALTTINKTVNEVVNNSATLQDDNQLLFTVGANETWAFRYVVQANTSVSAGIKFAITAPSGATCEVAFIDQQTASSESGIGCGTASTSLSGTGQNEVYEVVGTITNGATAGDVNLQWAQTVATAVNTTVLSGSYLTASIDGGGQVFLQNGNAFGGTAIIGTIDANGVNIITNNILALSFTSGGDATFASDVSVAGDLIIGTPPSPDVLAQAVVFTDVATNKGLVVQGTSSQSASLLEFQDNNGNILSRFDEAGGLVLGRSTSTDGTIEFNNSTNSNVVVLTTNAVLGTRTIYLPDEDGTICLVGSSNCGFIELGAGTVYTDATVNDTLAINKTSATGNLLLIQRSGAAVFTVANNGSLQIQATSASALDIRNAAGTSYLTVDTSTGTTTIDTLVLTNGISGAGLSDCDNTYSTLQWDITTGLFSCRDDSPKTRTFIDTTTNALVATSGTSYWDTAAENNNSVPNITLSSISMSVIGTVTVEFSSSTTQDRGITVHIERGLGSAPTCGSGVQVGGELGVFTSNSGSRRSSTVSFIDDHGSALVAYYTVCSDTDTSAASGITVEDINVTLEEASNSN